MCACITRASGKTECDETESETYEGKDTMTTKATTKTPRAAKPDANGQSTSPPKRAAKRELTLDEMSLRAYKMTYERLHGKGRKTAAKKVKSSPDAIPKAA